MKVLITGATGFVGSKLCLELTKAGHELIILTRNPDRARQKLSLNAQYFKWSPESELPPKEAITQADAIIHLLGENISARRWSTEQKERIENSRVKGTQNLTRAIDEYRETPLKSFVSTSAIGIYHKNQNSKIDENSPIDNQDFLGDVCAKWEDAAKQVEKASRQVTLRVGVVLDQGGGALEKLLPIFKLGLGGPIGNGKAMMSWIHRDDLVNAYIRAATDSEMNGVYNAVAPGPVTNKVFTKALANSLKMPALFPVPTLALKAAFGEMSSIMTDSQEVYPSRLMEANFQFSYPEIQSAFDEICQKKKISCFQFESWQEIEQDYDEVSRFFFAAENLKYLTPKEMGFNIEGTPEEMKVGAKHTYRFKLHSIPLKWKSQITACSPNSSFVDEQLHGPYQTWIHQHNFYPTAKGVLIEDIVYYRPPMGFLGSLAQPFIRKNLEGVFNFRKERLTKWNELKKEIMDKD